MRVPRNFRWAASRARAVWLDEGWHGLRGRTENYLHRRRLLGETNPSDRRLPMGPAGSMNWPRSLVVLSFDTPTQCYHYRVQQKEEACAELGIPFRVVNPYDYTATVVGAVQLASVVILYRVGPVPNVLAAIEQAKRLAIPLVFETDDAVYRRDLLEGNPNLTTVPRSLRKSVVKGADQYREVIEQVDHSLASTMVLAQDLVREKGGGHAFVMENGIDTLMLEIVDGVREDPVPPIHPSGSVVISYGSGSRAHDFDLEVAAPGIARVMAEYESVLFHLIGPVKLPDVLEPFSNRVVRTEAVSYPEFLRQLASADISIAPLADLPFNHFKSQVKYMESAMLGVPFVGSMVVYGDYVADGVTGFLAKTPFEWAEALGRLVRDPALRGQLAKAAAEDVERFRVSAGNPARQLAEMMDALS